MEHSSQSRAVGVRVRYSYVAMLLLLLMLSPLLDRSVATPFLPTGHVLSTGDIHLSLTYYSRWNRTPMPVQSGDTIAGDHIILNTTWTPLGMVVKTRIVVNATAIPKAISNESLSTTASVDTRQLGNNASCVIIASAWLYNGTFVEQTVTDVFVGNFLVPHVRVISPNGGEHWTGTQNITWYGWDNNSDEQLTYEVLLSSDSGLTFQLLAKELNNTWFTWYTQGFQNLSTYMIEIRVSDGIYMNYDTSDAPFTAGDVLVTTITTADQSFIVGLFISAAIISSAVISLVVYYAAKRWY